MNLIRKEILLMRLGKKKEIMAGRIAGGFFAPTLSDPIQPHKLKTAPPFFTPISFWFHLPFMGRGEDVCMNPTHPSPVPPPLPPSLPSQEWTSISPESVLRIFSIAIGLTLLSDFLLWGATPGISWGLFLVVIGAALVVNRPHAACKRTVAVLLGLLLATAIQSAVELSFTNITVGLALVVALVGELAYPTLCSGWERGSEALWALVKAPGRWIWASLASARLAWANKGIMGIVVRAIRIGLPALVLGVIFAAILGMGNAIFGSWIDKTFEGLWQWLVAMDLSVGHFFFFGLLATVALWALQPSNPGRSTRIWAREIPKIPVFNPSIAWWRSVTILVLLNALFFTVNTIDALFLWIHTDLPAGVTNSQYVHEGVTSLIEAVLLSAAVLAVLFQQNGGISQSPTLKRLGYAWIAQNFILIAGVMLRLVRYIHASQLTLQRVYVLCFVLLVATGFVLLAVHIARNRSLNWLIHSNFLATFALFFVLQFLNVAGWVAHYNVTRWEHDPKQVLDVAYLVSLESPAWPALQRVADSTRFEAPEAKRWLREAKANELRSAKESPRNWRSWQARYAQNVAWLLKEHP